MENTEIQKTTEVKETQLPEKSIRVISYIINLVLLAIAYFVLLSPIIESWGRPISHDGILTKILFFPIFGLAALLFMHKNDHRGIKIVSLIYILVPFLMMLYMLLFFDGSETDAYQFMEQRQWIRITDPPTPEPGEDFMLVMRMNYRVGVDGFSFPLMLLAGLIGLIGCIGSWGLTHRVKEYFAWYIVVFISITGTFVSLNYLLFYIFWEFVLIPMYFLIGIWGGPRKDYAAMKFLIYNLVGSILLIVAILWMFFQAGMRDFDMLLIAERLENNIPLVLGRWIWFATFLCFAIRMPIFPFHTWLPDTHEQSPTSVSVLLASILLPMGVYGLVRVSFANFPEATNHFIPLMIVLAVISIVYGACVALAQDCMKRLLSYASMVYMGFALLGLLSMNALGWTGTFMVVIGHGIVFAALFILVGVLQDRAYSTQINQFGGLMKYMRKYSIYSLIVALALLGLPGLVLFWGWFWSLSGAFSPESAYVSMMRAAVVISLLGVILTAAYTLWTYQRIFMQTPNEKWKSLKDINWREQLNLLPLIVIIIAIGIYPAPLINLFSGRIQGILEWIARF